MEGEGVQLLLEEVRNLAEDVEDLRSDMYSLRVELQTVVITLREEAQVIRSDTGSLHARAAAAFSDLHRRSDAHDHTETQTQTTLEHLQCALKDLQSKVAALRAEERPQTQPAPKPRSTALVEPGVAESASTGALTSAPTSAAVDEDATGSEDAAPRIIDK